MAVLIPLRKSAGQRRRFVQLQKGVAVLDGLGGRSQTWPEFGQDWVAIDPTPIVASEIQATVLYNVSMRYRADVVENFLAGIQQRVVDEGQGLTLKVLVVVNPEERNRDLVLSCAQAIV